MGFNSGFKGLSLLLTCILVLSLGVTSAAVQRVVYTEGRLLEDAASRSVQRHGLLLHWSLLFNDAVSCYDCVVSVVGYGALGE